MARNIFELAVALVQASPQVVPQLLEGLDKYLTPEQKRVLMAMQQSQSQSTSKRSSLLTSTSFQRPVRQPQIEQDLFETVRYVPQQHLKPVLLSIAKERHRQAKETHALVRFFFIICLITLVVGVVLVFIVPPAGGTLTVIGTFLSTVGGMILKTHSENNQRLDDIVKNIQSA